MYLLNDPDLLKRLMSRTGDGSPISIRNLAEAAGCLHGTIGNLLTAVQRSVPMGTAHRIAERIGVDVLILFTPNERAVSMRVVAESNEALTA